jgi:hypothetical protein
MESFNITKLTKVMIVSERVASTSMKPFLGDPGLRGCWIMGNLRL